jgi:hypothetical protein
MKIIDVPFAVLRFQYQFFRYPLQLIEDRVVTRMDSEAPGRLLYERSFGALDATVGNVLGDAELKRRGSALAERSDTLGRAARLDSAASQKEEHAAAELKAKRDKAVKDQKQARATKRRGVDQARSDADKRKHAAAQAAEKQAAQEKKQADEVAARRSSSIEAARGEEQSEIWAAERAATAAADAKLDDAQDKRRNAAGTRAQADRIEQLADAEKERRQTERANNA